MTGRDTAHPRPPDDLPAPRVDQTAPTVLKDAIDNLAPPRTLYWPATPASASTPSPASSPKPNRLLPEAVDHARDQELTCTEISQLLDIHPATASPPRPDTR